MNLPRWLGGSFLKREVFS